jgi:hypothetical protein
MLGFEHNHIDPHDAIPIHVLKVLLRKNLVILGPVIKQRVKEGVHAYLQSHSQDGTGTSISAP